MYLISPEGDYPRFRGDLKIAVPDWKEGDALPEGWVEVQDTVPPTTGIDEIYEELPPTQENGVWVRNWNVRPMTDEEIERRNAPVVAKQKLLDMGLTEIEIEALVSGLVR